MFKSLQVWWRKRRQVRLMEVAMRKQAKYVRSRAKHRRTHNIPDKFSR